MTNTFILFRQDNDNRAEFQAAQDIWGPDRCTRFLSDIPRGSLVVGRYSVLPFYKDVEDEIQHNGSRLINSIHAHHYIADMRWYQDLEGLTPQTWFNTGWANTPAISGHGYVVKGRTNSRKFKWDTHMRARNYEELKQVMMRLYDDPFIAPQGLVVREYIPLRQIEEGINGMPVTNEWRAFYYGTQLISAGYYWAQAEQAEDIHAGGMPREALALTGEAAKRVTDKFCEKGLGDNPFFVVDVGETEEGSWIVIEINSGQMSGLSMIDPHEFYTNLKRVIG